MCLFCKIIFIFLLNHIINNLTYFIKSTYTYSDGILISILSNIACNPIKNNGFDINMNHNSNNNPQGAFGLTLNIHLYCNTDLCNNYTYTNIPEQISSQLNQIPDINSNMSFLNKILMLGQGSSYAGDMAMAMTESPNLHSLIFKLTNTSNMADLVMNYANNDDITKLSEFLTEVDSQNGTKAVRIGCFIFF